MLFDMLVAPFDEGTNGGWSGVQNRDLVSFDDIPEAIFCRVIGSSLVKQYGGTIGQGAIDHVTVSRDPTTVCRAPVDIVFLIVKDPLERHFGVERIAGRCMFDTFGFSGRSTRIEDEEWGFRVQRSGRAILIDLVK